MASYEEATSKHATLVASTVDTVTLTGTDYYSVEVLHRSSSVTDPIYFTVDGSTPTVAGDDTYVVMPGGWKTVRSKENIDVVKLISAGTPAYSVTGEG